MAPMLDLIWAAFLFDAGRLGLDTQWSTNS
jgi:hypothetical protein